MFDLSKIFDLSKKFALPETLLKSKNYCTGHQKAHVNENSLLLGSCEYLERLEGKIRKGLLFYVLIL